MKHKKLFLKDYFINAIVAGELGSVEARGVVFTLKEFKQVFSHIKSDYINSFLPAATIETGMNSMTHTKFVFRIRKGVYLLHPDALVAFSCCDE